MKKKYKCRKINDKIEKVNKCRKVNDKIKRRKKNAIIYSSIIIIFIINIFND